jgi:hypothetical protein
MADVLIAVTDGPNGEVTIIHPVELTVDALLAQLPNNVISRIISSDELPMRLFRNAWRFYGLFLDIDMPHAIEIQKDRWREVRQPLLEALDIEYMRALETEDSESLDAIVAQKQALRDVTLIDLSGVETPEALADTWPEILGSH